MRAIINFLVLFLCININIILTTCCTDGRSHEKIRPIENWLENYVFSGISQHCKWYFAADFTWNKTRASTIVINNPPAHILQPDSFFGYNSSVPLFKYERVECEFDVEAPLDHALVVSIQQMNFDRKCSDFVQLTNHDGSLNKTICNKFRGVIPRSYPGSKYLGEFNSDEYYTDFWEESDNEGRIRVKISVTKENFENLRYLFIAFTAIKGEPSSNKNDNKPRFSLPPKYYCDGIKNWETAGDENNCCKHGSGLDAKACLILFLAIFVFCGIMFVFNAEWKQYERNMIPVQPLTTPINPVDTSSAKVDDNNDKELPTYGALFPDESQQVPSTSRR